MSKSETGQNLMALFPHIADPGNSDKAIGTVFLCSLSGFPRGIEKVLNREIIFQDLVSIAFNQNVHKILKRHGNSKFSRCLFKFCSLPLMTVLQVFFLHCVQE